MKPSLHRLFLSVHVWAGFSVGLVLVMLALTGMVILFRPQLEPVTAANLLRVDARETPLPLDELVTRARQAHGRSEVNYVRLFGDPRRSVMIRFKDYHTVYVNPYSAEILGDQNRSAGLFGRMVELHRLRYFGELGGEFTAICSLVFVAVILTGVVLWWPASRRALVAGLTLDRRQTGRRWTLGLHKTVGIYAAIIVMGSALTGAVQSFEWFKQALYPLSGSVPETVPVAANPGGTTLPLEIFRRQAAELSPGFSEMLINFPRAGMVDGYVVAADAPFPGAKSSFWFEAATGATLKFIPYAQASWGTRLYQMSYAFHTGQLGGVAGQLLLLAGTLSVPVLAITGLLSYRRRQARLTAGIAAKP